MIILAKENSRRTKFVIENFLEHDKYIIVPKEYLDLVEDLRTAVLLSYLVNIALSQERGKDKYISISRVDLKLELKMDARVARKCEEKLIDMGIIDIQVKEEEDTGLKTNHYKVYFGTLQFLIDKMRKENRKKYVGY